MQEFQVVRCKECQTFQVDIVKKAKKFTCKICNTKQSFVKAYFRSFTAKDCREQTRELNLKIQQIRTAENDDILDKLGTCDQGAEDVAPQNQKHESFSGDKPSKWSKFLKPEPHARSYDYNIKTKSNDHTPSDHKAISQLAPSSSSNSFHVQPPFSSKFSIYQREKSAALSELADLHKRPHESDAKFVEADNETPPNKKLKPKDDLFDDLFLSQDDINYIDGLQ